MGPHAGFLAGWALFGTYLSFTAASTAEAGTFGVAFFQESGIWPSIDWVLIALVAAALIAVLAYGDIRVATRSLLGFEGISVILIIILMAIIVVTLIGGSGPKGQTITLNSTQGGKANSASCSAGSAGRAMRRCWRWWVTGTSGSPATERTSS